MPLKSPIWPPVVTPICMAAVSGNNKSILWRPHNSLVVFMFEVVEFVELQLWVTVVSYSCELQLQLQVTVVSYSYKLQLWVTVVCYSYKLPLWVTVVSYSRELQLQATVVSYSCELQLRVAVSSFRCELQLRHPRENRRKWQVSWINIAAFDWLRTILDRPPYLFCVHFVHYAKKMLISMKKQSLLKNATIHFGLNDLTEIILM